MMMMAQSAQSHLKDAALMIFLFMYLANWCLYGVNETIARPMGYEMTWDGKPIGSEAYYILEAINALELTHAAETARGTMTATDSITGAIEMTQLYLYLIFDLFALLFGVQIFDILLTLGMDQFWVTLISSVYIILLSYAIMHYMPQVVMMLRLITDVSGQVVRILRP